MAYINLYRDRLQHNFNYLNNLFKENDIDWAVVTKLLCGHKEYLKEVLALGAKEVCDSRLNNLKVIKALAPEIQTVYIKPPPRKSIRRVVKYADVSFNSDSKTIKLLSEEAVKQNKIHKVTIMIELGDLREGIMGDDLMGFYEEVFQLPNIEITAIGANLNCLHGVMPSSDKLIQLSLYKQLIEIKFNKKIPWVTGGTSVVIPLLLRKQVPKAINHFRVGEALYFANSLFSGETFPGMKADVFRLFAEIIEITKKPTIPTGEMMENPAGDVFEIDENEYGKTAYRAILDVGLLDMAPEYLEPDDEGINVVNASSDMLIVDLRESKKFYKVGEYITFKMKYMGALRLINSDYIEKRIS